MTKLLKKEFSLCLHPTSLMFIGLAAMVLIPGYPFTVSFFYTTLGIFFVCVTGRENNDIFYSMLLPIKKSDIVLSRLAFVAVMELCQIVACAGFAMLRGLLEIGPNSVGLDANFALFAAAFIMFGLFNMIFFPWYYKDVTKIGLPFFVSSVAVFLFAGIAEGSSFVIPFVRDALETEGGTYMPQKLLTLGVGMTVYAVLTLFAFKLSKQRFEKQDL